MLKLYLDSSAIVKRYVNEPGTQAADLVFERAEGGQLVISFSLWNIGEVLGVLDERRRRGWLSDREFTKAQELLADELLKLMRLRVLEIVPILSSILIETWGLILDHHVYEADALQVTTCQYNQSDALLSSDEDLVEASEKLGVKSFHMVKEEHKLRQFIKTQ